MFSNAKEKSVHAITVVAAIVPLTAALLMGTAFVFGSVF